MALTTEHFTRALELTHTFSPDVTQRERLMAEQYLMNLRATADGLNLAFHIVSNEPVREVRCFWAFNTIMHHLPDIACGVSTEQAEELYKTLFSFIYRYFFSSSTVMRQPMDFLANKHAQMMVAGLQEFFPTRWRTFFDDLFELLMRSSSLPQVSDAVTVYFLRIFEYIDERVVSVRSRSDRAREQRTRDMEVKDAMREGVMPRAVATWYAILCDSRIRSPEVANVCLGVLQTYVEWVDVGLFITAEWINLLYFLITIPAVRGAACECVLGLVEKKQLPAVKLESLRTLNIVDALPRIASLVELPANTEEAEIFLEVVTRLVRSVAEQFLTLFEHISAQCGAASTHGPNCHAPSNGESNGESDPQQQQQQQFQNSNHMHDSATHPVGTNEVPNNREGSRYPNPYQSPAHPVSLPDLSDTLAEAQQPFASGAALPTGAFPAVNEALHTVVTHLLSLLRADRSDVREILLPFVQAYIKSPALREEQAAELLLTLYDQTKIRGLEHHVERIWLDGVIDERKQLHNLTRLLFRRHPAIVLQHLHEVLQRVSSHATEQGTEGGNGHLNNGVLQQNPMHSPQAMNSNMTCDNSGRTAEETEAALRYFYEIGEAIRMEKLRDAQNEFAQLLRLLIVSEHIVRRPCPAIHLSYFEVMDRYYLFFMYHRDYIPLLLQSLLLLPCGVTNQNDRVRSRICYFFGHLVQVLRPAFTPHRRDIVNALLAICSADGLLANDRRELYEAAGTLMSLGGVHASGGGGSITSGSEGQTHGAASHGTEGGTAMIAEVMYSLTENLRAVSSSSASSPSAAANGVTRGNDNKHTHTSMPFPVNDPVRSEAVADAISFLTALAKGLRGDGPTVGSGAGGSSRASGSLGTTPTIPPPLMGNDATPMAEMFHSVTEDVMEAMSLWRAAPAVRDRTAQYYTQMVHLLPFESMGLYFTAYCTRWLAWMEAIPELIKLLRLLFQFVHRNSQRGADVLRDVLPLVLQKVSAVGELSVPPIEMGVVSESTREKLDVYRQLFNLLHGATGAGCASVIFALPPPDLHFTLAQWIAALFLPVDSELPKLGLQILGKITAARVEDSASGILSQSDANHDHPSQSAGGLHKSSFPGIPHSAPNGNHESGRCAYAGGADWVHFMLHEAIPSLFRLLLSPEFDLRDAKVFFLIGEAGALLKALMDRLGPNDPSLCVVLCKTLEPIVGTEEAHGFVAALQGEARFTTAMKMRMRNMLQTARDAQTV